MSGHLETPALRLHRLRRHAPQPRATALTIGNFDGVHRGHQALITAMDGPVRSVLTFEPLPREYFHREQAPARLSSLREKASALSRTGVDEIYVARFDGALASLSAEDFVREILHRRLGAQSVHVGHDFRFGAGRRGDFDLLARMGRQLGFRVQEQPPFCLDGERVSSTGIRQFLHAGKMDAAARWLGRPYAICGRVVGGDRIGRELGFPTANIDLARRPPPLRGIFAGVLHTPRQSWPAAISIGLRPTVGGKRLLLEAHCLDVTVDLYGQRVEVQLLHKWRDEAHYAQLDELIAAIGQDVAKTRQYFLDHPDALGHPWITRTA
ncbi:bifunctional riboflavin kinase/FAD synthetase [Acidithiobacillus caldus]|jgi:riboflavin kinase/FMN adenylyltransferase|uniref:Riboflavin biosynthesis protein n=1 Tax=Acidithiobacillus caldus (strain ATCC 51756 / DSM 8584 / KU) TaxID=637389 RepID=A0A059ZUS7_ACICK|nr:bifunctional riboflavin kinase/FAD synthetase [Acidithiobacillus caldus]AIA55350.1 Riboflavin kinase / FMN adenylyltransferase [Acidithiobacillus caldus ATCC 51756]MBU2729579.1 bifunctional riboflavin kinase/FAD synthetase [Acidithiobacillus caldus]MBU2734926.1 bifunctional riboflavin kinase/FAD synthetase [Acidithiobacillus caldus ATCC 51756]MBU2744208.1 bifunctional riboflavin kinase/FAD synthetase [Acidithiobacillus caldus]MBU2780656.1 bifunctional riboflavin kinase/FAD synthetase [Acidi